MNDPYETVKDRTSVLGPTIQFKGELSAEEDLVILGKVEGSIIHKQRLTIGREGTVHASVDAQTVIIEGAMDGDVRAEKSVSVKESARMTGNISAPSVTILQGASFNGNVDMVSGKQPRSGSTGDTARLRRPPGAG